MKGQAKRFLNQKGKAYDMGVKIPSAKGNIGYLDLWRYATWGERCCTALGAVIAWVCSLAQITAVIVYGELTALFVERSAASATTPRAPILTLFGGGEIRAAGNRKLHMDALVNDSTAFALASITIMCIQLSCAATAVALANGAAAKMVTRVRLQLLRSVVSQEIAFFDTNTTMNFASAVTEDMEKLRAGVGQTIVMLSYLSGTVFCGCTLSLVYGWELTLAALAIVPFAILVQAVVAKNQTKCSEKETVAFNKAGRVTDEVLSAIRTVRAYAGEEMEVQRYSEALSGADKAVRRRGAWAGAGLGLGWLLTYSLNAVVFAYGAQLVVRDRGLPPDQQDYHPGIMVTILFCTFMAAQNIAMCSPHLEVIAAARGAAKSLFKILEKKSKINALENTGVKPDRFRGDIEFDNIYFNYPSRSDVKVLRGLSLKINAGETVALVGTSGCGKSTLLQLLQRMYEPDAGTVLVDGLRLNELNLHHFRTSIGVVGQEPVLFSGTIRDNITLGAGEVSEERVIAAAKTAHAHKFITKLADGYETVLGERGAALSGGQKQRIAIARAVLRNPAILLLDEPTSALDPTAERLVQSALDAASVGRTTLVVSHRLSTIENADRIVYVNLGTCAEQGTHSELVEKKGLYWNLLQQDMTHSFVATQSETNDDDEPPALDELLTKEKSQAFVRSLSGRASYRGSFKAAWRQSASMRAPSSLAPAHDMLTEILEEEELQNETPVKGATALQLARLHKPEWCVLAIGGLASFTVGATMPAFAYLFSKLYGMFALSDGEAVLRASRLYAGLFFGVAALCGLVTFLQAWCFNLAGARLTHRLRKTTFQNFLIQEQAWFDQPENATGALGARLATDCAAVQGATGTRLGTVLQGISTMVLGVGLAMLYSWKMTLVSLLSVPCVIGGIYLEGWVNQRNAVREKRALEEAARLATEACLNIRTVQSLGIETLLTERFEAALREADSKAANGRRIRPFVYGLCQCAPTTGYAVSLAYGGYLIAREDLPYEYAILVSEALIYGAWMLAEALSFAPSFAAARRSATRIIAALSRKPLVVTEATATELKDWNCTGEVTYTNISFRYPSRPKTAIIRGLSVKLEAGKTIALVGPSGCGKSTLMHILLRNYDASEGTVTLDGHDIRHSLTLTQLRAQLGLVSQEPALFERSLRDNIAYGDNARSVPMEEIIHAAKQSNVHNFIVSLPMGYDTVLGQGGAALSGGQKQRVAIARALVRNPRVLLLDEATSALDADSEKKVQEALEVASKDRSTMIIAHRLATVRHAHTICVIAKGVVAESGSHDELVAKRGLYLELLKQQGGGG